MLVARPGAPALALEIQYADLSAHSWRARHAGYASMRIDDLWLLGHTRLRLRGESASLDSLSSALLAAGQPLIYLNPKPRRITWLEVPPAARFRAQRGERLGRTQVSVRRAHLSQLHLDGITPTLELDAPAPLLEEEEVSRSQVGEAGSGGWPGEGEARQRLAGPAGEQHEREGEALLGTEGDLSAQEDEEEFWFRSGRGRRL